MPHYILTICSTFINEVIGKNNQIEKSARKCTKHNSLQNNVVSLYHESEKSNR